MLAGTVQSGGSSAALPQVDTNDSSGPDNSAAAQGNASKGDDPPPPYAYWDVTVLCKSYSAVVRWLCFGCSGLVSLEVWGPTNSGKGVPGVSLDFLAIFMHIYPMFLSCTLLFYICIWMFLNLQSGRLQLSSVGLSYDSVIPSFIPIWNLMLDSVALVKDGRTCDTDGVLQRRISEL